MLQRRFANYAKQFCNITTELCNVAKELCNIARELCNVARELCNIARVFCNIAKVFCIVCKHFCNVARELCNVARELCNIAKHFCKLSWSQNVVYWPLFCSFSPLNHLPILPTSQYPTLKKRHAQFKAILFFYYKTIFYLFFVSKVNDLPFVQPYSFIGNKKWPTTYKQHSIKFCDRTFLCQNYTTFASKFIS